MLIFALALLVLVIANDADDREWKMELLNDTAAGCSDGEIEDEGCCLSWWVKLFLDPIWSCNFWRWRSTLLAINFLSVRIRVSPMIYMESRYGVLDYVMKKNKSYQSNNESKGCEVSNDARNLPAVSTRRNIRSWKVHSTPMASRVSPGTEKGNK